MNGLTKALLALAVIAIAAASIAAVFAVQFISTPASSSSEEIVFEVKPGESFKTVTRELEQAGLVANAKKLELYGRFTRFASRMRVGEYLLKKNLKPREILSTLSSGQSIQYSVTVSEGLNRYEIAEIFAKQKICSREDFLKMTGDPVIARELLGREAASLEGYLFPETYFFTKYTGARGLIRMMVDRYKDAFKRVQREPGWTMGEMNEHQLVTLASIVEKETGAPEERPVISSVFHNRLKKKMALQTDPTIVYGIYVDKGEWDGAIGRADLKRPSPYNSYLNSGLPPGPISNPGYEALKAAGAPVETEFLFFVSQNNGTHVFSREYGQHAKAVEKFQLDRRAREGKSWRDLQKRQNTPAQVTAAPPIATPSPKAKKK